MNIVVLDGYTLNPGDLSWEPLQSIGRVEIHDRTPPSQILERAAHAEILLTNKTVLNGEVLRQLPKLKYIGVLATGTNVVDIPAAHERGVVVTNVPAYATPSVAQLVFALLFELSFHTGQHAQSVRSGGWARSKDFSYWEAPLVELAGLTLGLVGFGNIGKAVASIGSALDMKLIVHTRRPISSPEIRAVDLETVFRESDVLSLHCPLTPETTRLINTQRLGWMKRSAFLINTGRGPLIDEPALADALNAGRIAGAGLDVLSVEPPSAHNPLLHARNCIITPHIGWATHAARVRLMTTAVDNIRAFLDGHPQNVVTAL